MSFHTKEQETTRFKSVNTSKTYETLTDRIYHGSIVETNCRKT